MGRPPVLRAAVGLLALLAAGAVVAGPGRAAWQHWQAERAWPHDQELVSETIAAVRLPDAYVPTACADAVLPPSARCWTVRLTPSEALPDLRAAAGAVGSEVEEPGISAPATPDGPAGVGVSAVVDGTDGRQGIALVATRDLDASATTKADLFLGTSTVTLAPALAPPS